MKDDVRLNKGGNMDSFFNSIDKYIDNANKDDLKAKKSAQRIIEDCELFVQNKLRQIEHEMAYEYDNTTGQFSKTGRVLNSIHQDLQSVIYFINDIYYELNDDGMTRSFTTRYIEQNDID